MSRLPECFVERVREAVDLADVIGHDVKLRRSGSVLRGRSPFVDERTPSFTVWPATQTWHDFAGGGGAGGDVFDYVMARQGCGFREAVLDVADRAGLRPPAESPALAAELAAHSSRREVEQLLGRIADQYHRALPADVRDRWYRAHYGFTDETIARFRLGYADGGLAARLLAEGLTPERLLATGLFIRRSGGALVDLFTHRLVFPFIARGRVVGFSARATERTPDAPYEQAKYKRPLRHSSEHPEVSPHLTGAGLFNVDAFRGADEVLIAEGITDCISAAQAGFAAFSPATTRLRSEDLDPIVRALAHVHRVVICFDAEASDAGLKGAEATADDLFDAGLPVSIATLPRPEEVAKVDLNDYLKAHGADALRAVLAAARPVIEHHLAAIPADTPAVELPRRLRPLLARLDGRTSIERDAAIDAVCARFKLQRRSVRTLLPRDAAPKPTASLRGAVHVEGGHYAAWLGPTPSAVSSFVLDLQERVVVEGGAELLLCALRCENGRRVDGLHLTAADFHSRQALLKALGVPDAQWTGTDEHAQGVLRLLTAAPGPQRRGARVLGLATTPAGPRWVGPHAIIAADAIRADDPAIRFVGEDGALTRSLRIAATPDAELRALAAAALPALIALNEPAVMLPLLGWFHAAPLRAFVRERLGHFPLLVVWGTQGSGKTTLVCEVLWPLFGVEAALPFSANATEFTLLKLMASTNAVPVVLDEYKPSDMAQGRLAALHRLLRQGYTGELAQRGRSDQTVVDYALDAPVCLIGECRPIEPALLERMVSARPDKNAIATHPARREVLRRLRALPLARLAGPYLRFALGQDVDTLLGVARRELTRCLGERAIPLRVQDNLIALLVGLILFDRFAADCGAPLPAPDFALAIRAVLADVLDGDGQVKSGLDHFLEQLAAAAVNGMAMPSRHYLRDEDTLYVHLASAHAVYREHCRRTAWRGEVIDENALRRQAREELERGGYVLAVSHQVIFGQRLDRRRVLVIDLERARRSLDVDGFAASESQNPLDSRPRESLHGPASATLAGRAYHDGEMP